MAKAREPRGEIAVGDVLQEGSVEFEMDRSVEVDWSSIFTKHADGTFLFRQDEESLLNLSCLNGLRNNPVFHFEKERFLPDQIFVREYMQMALKLRLDNFHGRTIVFGSPGIGKSVFAFLAAIAFASLGVTETRTDAVLYVRKVTDETEGGISVFWMTRKDDRFVKIVATRRVDKNWSVNDVCRAIHRKFFCGKINMVNTPASNGVKIIVDGPQYGGDRGPTGSDLVSSGGCPPQKQENMGEWHFAFSPWTIREMAAALKSLKNCNKGVTKKIFDTTGGSIRLALQCCGHGDLDEQEFAKTQRWMNGIVDKQALKPKIDMAYYSTELSADPNSIDRLRTMIVTETTPRLTPPWFKVTLFLASPYVAGLLQSKLTLEDMLNALNFARNSGIGSLYGWHFELWAHRVSEIAVDEWRKQFKKKVEDDTQQMSSKVVVGHVQGTVAALNSVLMYWKPSVSNFANIDSAILLQDGTLCCLQFTVEGEHAFNFKTFKSKFLDNIPKHTWSAVKKIVVLFVIPMEKSVFSSVRVPYAQADICTKVVEEEKSSPKIRYVKNSPLPLSSDTPAPMETENKGGASSDEDNMDEESLFSSVTEFDEELDYEFFLDETDMPDLNLSDWDTGNVKMVFKWMPVDPGTTKAGDSPFFSLASGTTL